jgi:hypothetical protein
MTRFCLTVLFSAISVTGLALVMFAILAGRRNRAPVGPESLVEGLSDSAGEPGGVLDLDMGHEGLKHREKEAFDPDKHKPEPIDARTKN